MKKMFVSHDHHNHSMFSIRHSTKILEQEKIV